MKETTNKVTPPSWNDAPEWANYLTVDENGYWEWHEKKPSEELEDMTVMQWWSHGRKQSARENFYEPQIFQKPQ